MPLRSDKDALAGYVDCTGSAACAQEGEQRLVRCDRTAVPLLDGGQSISSSSAFSSSSSSPPPWVRHLVTAPRQLSSMALLPLAIDTKLIAATIGGLFAGGLHAVTGPDHLAALLPLCMGRRWWVAIYTGGYWGLGHGIGAALVGALAFAVRDALNLDALSLYMEAAVGISIIIIGANGVRESREWSVDHEGPTEQAKQHSLEVHAALMHCIVHTASAPPLPQHLAPRGTDLTVRVDGCARDAPQVAMNQPPQAAGTIATLGTGILHGCSGSGHLLGVMPALAMPSWKVAVTYLCMFGIGTMVAMSFFTAVVGELSSQMSERLNDPRTPGRLALVSSLFALTMGTVWTARAVLQFLPRRLALA